MTDVIDNKPKRSWWSVSAGFLSLLCSIALIPIVLVAIARILHFENVKILVLLTAFATYLFLPVYFMLVFALLAKRKMLRIVCAVLVILHIFWMQEGIRPATKLPAATASAPKFTVLSQNLRFDNPIPGDIISTIRRTNADILLFQELTYNTAGRLKDSGALDPYSYSFENLRPGADGIGMWSKFPLETKTVVRFGLPAQRVTMTVEGRELTVWNIHTMSPIIDNGNSTTLWRNGLRDAKNALHAEQGNVIAAGDFNATWSHYSYRSIVSNGYRDVHTDRGRGYARTWPVSSDWLDKRGGLIRIDHVLTKGNVRATSIHQVPGLGSDHRGNLTTFALL